MDIFKDSTSKLPKSDKQIQRIDFRDPALAGKPPAPAKTGAMAIRHVPNVGSKD